MQEQLIAEIPQETLERIKFLSKQSGLSEETVIITALILGTIELKKEIEEDD